MKKKIKKCLVWRTWKLIQSYIPTFSGILDYCHYCKVGGLLQKSNCAVVGVLARPCKDQVSVRVPATFYSVPMTILRAPASLVLFADKRSLRIKNFNSNVCKTFDFKRISMRFARRKSHKHEIHENSKKLIWNSKRAGKHSNNPFTFSLKLLA